MDLDNWVIPQTVKEGRKYCKYFNNAMLETKKKFHKNFSMENQFLFVNLPRSGSNLIKSIIENITGFYASDPIKYSPFGQDLLMHGVCHSSHGYCQIIKTHHPHWDYILNMNVDIYCKKAIILTRDPVPQTDSYFHMFSAISHDDKVEGNYFNDPIYKTFIKDCADQYKRFHDYWFNEDKVLKYWVRFEDYCEKPKETIINIFTFLEGTTELRPEILDRINELDKAKEFFKSPYRVLNKYSSKVDVYKEMPEELVKYIYKTNLDILQKLKYVKQIKEKAPYLKDCEGCDEEKWIELTNQQSMERSLKTKLKDIPNFLLPKPKSAGNTMSTSLRLIDTIYVGKGTWKKLITKAHQYHRYQAILIFSTYYQLRFYTKYYIILFILICLKYLFDLKLFK